MAYSELELLARLIQCEAGGEGEAGMRAVASVVMNRVQATLGEYARVSDGGSIYNIVFQPLQFECALEDNRGQNIYNMRPTALEYAIAEWALSGGRLDGIGEALWFFNPYSDVCPENFPSEVGTYARRIGNHCFYTPTAAYYET
ncbi:MAG: cell wall hydrolase [Clostridia bacterium]|nr:cell wall hydrolase [Clostridia bacterium]